MDTLLDSGKYSDLQITCDDRTWNVHRAVVRTASPVFAAMVDGGFKEAQYGVIDLPADQPEIVEMMLRFLYQGKYNDTRPTSPLQKAHITSKSDDRGGLKFPPPLELREGAMVVNVKMYVMADKYNIPALKRHARAKYKEILKELVSVAYGQAEFGDAEFECSVHCLQGI